MRKTMKTIPKYIKNLMRSILNYHVVAANKMDELENWLENQGIDTSTDFLRDGCGIGLDELEYGNDCVEKLCTRIECKMNNVPFCLECGCAMEVDEKGFATCPNCGLELLPCGSPKEEVSCGDCGYQYACRTEGEGF